MGKGVRDQDTPLCKNQIVKKKKVLDSPGGKQNYSSNPPPLGKIDVSAICIFSCIPFYSLDLECLYSGPFKQNYLGFFYMYIPVIITYLLYIHSLSEITGLRIKK